MPPDLPNEQEIILKKRARRRLVGAIALVLMMIVILPMILKDRAALVEQESIKITMPESNLNEPEEKAVVPVPDLPPVEAAQTAIIEPDIQSSEVEPIKSESVIDKTTEKKVVAKQEASIKAKTEEKAAQLNAAKPTATEVKTPSSFIVQIGVYSELANVKQLQEKSKQAGYKSNIETIKTPKGEKYRLRTSSFVSRQSAADALVKLQAAGLPGMVMSND